MPWEFGTGCISIFTSKYLESCHQLEHSAVDAQYTRPPRLQPYRHKSSLQHLECDLDCHELHPSCLGFERTGTSGITEAKDMLPHSMLLSPPRLCLTTDSFPERVASTPSLSCFRVGKSNDWNGGLTRSCHSSNDVQNAEASVPYNHDTGYDKLRARLLIDAYGSEDASPEKLPKFQRLDFNGISSNTSTKDLRSFEEEYAWECMSPTLSNQIKRYNAAPFAHVTGSTRVVNDAYLGKEIGSDWHNQAALVRFDEPVKIIASVSR